MAFFVFLASRLNTIRVEHERPNHRPVEFLATCPIQAPAATIALFHACLTDTTTRQRINPASSASPQFVHLHPNPAHPYNNPLPFRNRPGGQDRPAQKQTSFTGCLLVR